MLKMHVEFWYGMAFRIPWHGYESETHIEIYWKTMVNAIYRFWCYRKLGRNEERKSFGQSTKDKPSEFRSCFNITIAYNSASWGVPWWNVRFQLMREDIPVSKRVRAALWSILIKNIWQDWSISPEKILITTHYDSDMGLGFGVNVIIKFFKFRYQFLFKLKKVPFYSGFLVFLD
jgi:hypothetical protein